MNKSALKKFAIDSRNELREKVKIKALKYGVSEEHIAKEDIISSDAVFIDGKQLSVEEQKQRNKLIEEIKTKGYNQVIEEVAYTWFNRFTALRFMEVNNYLPTKIRVLSSTIEGSYEPDIIREALNIDLNIDKELVYELKISTENDAIDRLYKYLVIKQCNELGKILPFMFEKISDYTELLFPDGLLDEGSFIRKMTDTEVFPEEYWEDVEIIGWLYQYYIAEENDRVIRAKKRYKKEEIPFATQLFTPNWIVRYMVQNSLGRYWIESHPEDRELIEDWEFYLENPNPEPDLEEKLAPYLNKNMKVEEIKCFDPAMGSGHILVYMFDVLYQIYKKHGYMDIEIPKLIIENNLYGLDIDDRAYQLACFAVIMKAQQYNDRFLRDLEKQVEETGEYIKLNLASIQETNDFNLMDIEYLAGESEGKNFDKTKAFIEQFKNAKIYGSLTEIKEFDEEFLIKRADEVVSNPAERMEYQASKNKVDKVILDLIKQTRIMVEMYDVLVTNPPYMGGGKMNPLLSDFLSDNYKKFKADTFSAFISMCVNKVHSKGHLAFLTPFVWMYLSSYVSLRELIVLENSISSLIELEYNAFPEACVPVCTFTIRNYNIWSKGEFIDLTGFPGPEKQALKVLDSIQKDVNYRYSINSSRFQEIEDMPISYWVTDRGFNILKNERSLSYYAQARKGMNTSNNDRFLRFWFEIENNRLGIGFKNASTAKKSNYKWFPYNKGGGYRKWYGNNLFVINFKNDGEEVKNYKKSDIRSPHLYYRDCLTWSAIGTTKPFSIRYSDIGAIFDSAGSSIFFDSYENMICFLGLMQSKIANYFLKAINPTMNYGAGSVAKVPIILSEKSFNIIKSLTLDNIQISKTDWDSFETSWNFEKHPILIHKGNTNTIEEAFNNWSEFTHKQFYQLKANEEELNRIFIDIYGLEDELTPEVEDKDITISKVVEEKSEKDKKNSYTVDRKEAIQSFISYGVGCIFGRYSLDEDGLAYAGGDFDPSKYKTFPADKDNVIPVISNRYFENDIVSRFVDFVRITFGEENLSGNLQYIAESIGMRANEVPRETLRRYFINNFFKDHTQTYKKRPIYWMFTSGNRKTFNALIYMHRYDRTSLAKIRTNYLHVLQSRLEGEKQSLYTMIKDAENTREKRQLEEQISEIEKDLLEIKEYDEKLHHMADMMIDIDLDDGVKANYEKFEGLVQKI